MIINEGYQGQTLVIIPNHEYNNKVLEAPLRNSTQTARQVLHLACKRTDSKITKQKPGEGQWPTYSPSTQLSCNKNSTHVSLLANVEHVYIV